MQPTPTGHGRSLRLAGALFALLALLAVVAFASRTGFGHTNDTAPTPAYVSWAMSVFLVLFAVMTPVAAYLYLTTIREVGQKRSQRSFQARLARSLGIMFLLFGLGGLALWFRSHHGFLLFNRSLANAITGKHRTPAHGAQTYKPTFQYPVLWIALVVLAAAVIWFWWVQSHKEDVAAAEPEPTIEQEVAASIGDAIDDLVAEQDARRAVIAAYARMEQAFARNGLRRRASETPVEYLRRILLGLTSRTEAVSRLTTLFERAKFSHHPIDGTMKQDAIDALRAIRDDLQAVTG
jgi:Domain of unknown function (DUF4129)